MKPLFILHADEYLSGNTSSVHIPGWNVSVPSKLEDEGLYEQ